MDNRGVDGWVGVGWVGVGVSTSSASGSGGGVPRRSVIYTRISRDREGAGLGVGRQRDECQQLAEGLGWTVVGIYEDNDISAYSGKKRSGYDAMVDNLGNKHAQAIIAWHPDRLHRRPIELESFIDLCDRKRIEIATVQAGDMDLSTANGKMVARIVGATARHEVEHSIERAKSAKKQAAEAGTFRGGRRSLGFEPDGMTLRQKEADAIRAGADHILAGGSLAQLVRVWNCDGLRTSFGDKEFTPRDVKKILLRPRNAGIVLHEGKPFGEGQWQKIIDDPDTYKALCAQVDNPDRRTSYSRERKYQGSGIYVCGRCGERMRSAQRNRSGSGEWRRTYVCSKSKHLGRDIRYVDEFVSTAVIERLSWPDAAIALGDASVDITELHGRNDGCRARLDELATMFAAGDIDGAQLKRGTADLNAKVELVEAELLAARSGSVLASLVLAGDDLRSAWENSPADFRAKVIDALMTVTILPTPPGRQPGGGYFLPEYVQIEWRR
ncbi:MAG: recombinase family protein [Mycobacterium sp.]|nr:recombinase family protein [Mycobacterium sp.]